MTSIISRSHPCDPEKTAYEDALARLFVSEAGANVLFIPHIYHIAHNDAVWKELGKMHEPLIVLTWLYPRPARWALLAHTVGEAGLTTLDMAAHESPQQCFDACAQDIPKTAQEGTVSEIACETSPRWYPVIDRSRCVNCGQCMQFCLFGVYELDAAETVRATHPDNCKPGCPACARICPEGAIMFPLCDKDEAIAGAPQKFVGPHAAAKKKSEKRTRRPHEQPQVADDLDVLIDDLDRLTEGTP